MTLGVGALAVLARYMEWGGIAAIVLALVFFGFYFLRKRKAPAVISIVIVRRIEQEAA